MRTRTIQPWPVTVLLAAMLAPALHSMASERDKSADALWREFQDPPKRYSVRPFWFWNSMLDVNEIERQMRVMLSQGVYGAYAHNRTGLLTPYLSDEYFRIVRESVERASRLGFQLMFVDEYEWPGGEARDVWLKGLPSRVLAEKAEYRMRNLDYQEREAAGPSPAVIETPREFQFAVAFQTDAAGAVRPETLTLLETDPRGGPLRWDVPAGRWRILLFYLTPAMGVDNGMVDLLNPDAVSAYIRLVHTQYERHIGRYFGKTIDSFYSDHEGDYGYRIAWTPGLFDRFRQAKGYDLRPWLPLLLLEGGPRTPKVRCDYLDLIGELYASSYFEQVSRWLEARGVSISGHSWEETLRAETAFVGDHFRQMRAWSWPGIDSLWDTGRLPRDFKAAASAAHFRQRRFTVENQGLHGVESFLDMQKMRLGTNMIAVWGADLLIPHAFNYHPRRIEYPPDWFEHQPYWKHFRHYADYARRLSFMNSRGVHAAPLLVFHPIETGWAHSAPVFRKDNDYRGLRLKPWGGELDEIDNDYTALLNGLPQRQWDYDLADSHFLAEAEIRGGRLHIGPESFRALLLPPATLMRQQTLAKVRRFFEQGGLVIAWKRLPADSMEAGRNDPVIAGHIQAIFGDGAGARSRSHPSGGRSFFVTDGLDEVVRLLEETVPRDAAVVQGSPAHFFYQHRREGPLDFYWVVNDSENPRTLHVRFPVSGTPEKWDAASATRGPLRFRPVQGGTEVELRFDAWDAFYVVWRDTGAAGGNCGVVEERQIVSELDGLWRFRIEGSKYTAPYGRVRAAETGTAAAPGWEKPDVDDSGWQRTWLSRERFGVRSWWIGGPFPNPDHRGFDEVYGPEKGVDLGASYERPGGAPLAWRHYASPGYVVDLFRALDLTPATHWVVVYTYTRVHSPVEREAEFRIAANNNAKLWVNGQNLLDWHIHPYYHELREAFALARPGRLRAGWNEILVKVERGNRGQFGFYLRITDQFGNTIPDLRLDTPAGPVPLAAADTASNAPQWYRIPAPPGARAVQLPSGVRPAAAYLDGTALPLSSSLVDLPASKSPRGGTLTLVMPPGQPLPDSPVFHLSETALPPGSWLDLGLPYFSGTGVYEYDLFLRDLPEGRRLILDLGETGVTAEVWINGRHAGTRVWRPFTVDATRFLRRGVNRIRAAVSNTMENERAVENHAAKLEKLRQSGLLGPVRLLSETAQRSPCRLP